MAPVYTGKRRGRKPGDGGRGVRKRGSRGALGRHKKSCHSSMGQARPPRRGGTQGLSGGRSPGTKKRVREMRRVAALHQYYQLGEPSRGEWGGHGGAVAQACRSLGIAASSASVVRAAWGHEAAHSATPGFDPATGKRKPRREIFKLTPSDKGAAVLAGSLAAGSGQYLAGLHAGVSQSTVSRIVHRPEFGCTVSKITAEPQGSKDPNGTWAKSRFAFAQQLKRRLVAGHKLSQTRKQRKPSARKAVAEAPLHVSQILFLDEGDKKQTYLLGNPHATHDYQFLVDEKGCYRPPGAAAAAAGPGCECSDCDPDEAGPAGAVCLICQTAEAAAPHLEPGVARMTAAKYRKQLKHTQTAGACYGVAAPVVNGKQVGKRMVPIFYTGAKVTKVVGPKKMEEARAAEQRAKAQYSGPKGQSEWRHYTAGNVYKQRYEKEGQGVWEAKLNQVVARKFTCVTALMDHAIEQGDKMFAGTAHEDDWVIYHDCLTAWWCPDAQRHMTAKGFANRQIRPVGQCAAGAIYNPDPGNPDKPSKPMGDSPTMMPLDCCLFKDAKDAAALNCMSTAHLAKDDKERFLLTTPKEIERCMKRTWEAAPSSDRIVEDILKWEGHIDTIIANKGALVASERKHKAGHRKRRKADPQKRLGSLHPAAQTHYDTRLKQWQLGQIANPSAAGLTGAAVLEDVTSPAKQLASPPQSPLQSPS